MTNKNDINLGDDDVTQDGITHAVVAALQNGTDGMSALGLIDRLHKERIAANGGKRFMPGEEPNYEEGFEALRKSQADEGGYLLCAVHGTQGFAQLIQGLTPLELAAMLCAVIEENQQAMPLLLLMLKNRGIMNMTVKAIREDA